MGSKNQVMGLKIREVERPRHHDEGIRRAATEPPPLLSLAIAFEGFCLVPFPLWLWACESFSPLERLPDLPEQSETQ
jgi:hypothetical protein